MASDTKPPLDHSSSTIRSTTSLTSSTSISSSTSSSSTRTSIPSPSSLYSSVPTTSSTKTSTSLSPSSQVAWGPAVIASAFSPMSTEAAFTPGPAEARVSQVPGPLELSEEDSGFSKESSNILIATTVVGGTFIIALLIYAIYKRQRGATYAQILHVKPRPPSTVVITPVQDRFKPLPIVRDIRYSVHSSKHDSAVSSYPVCMRQKAVPYEVADRFHQQNTYIQNTWQTDLRRSRRALPPPPLVPQKDPKNRSTFLFDASPTFESTGIKEPEKARISVSVRPRSSLSRPSRLSIITADSENDSIDEAFHTPPGSPHSHKLLAKAQEHWSWTNSQAPSTPHMWGRASQDVTSSRGSMPRFRSVVSWVRGQSERIDEEMPAIPASPQPQPPPKIARPVLKNQAVKPVLAPVKLPNPRRPSLTNAPKQSFSLFKMASRQRSASKDSEGATGLPSTIEMNERSSA